MATHAFSVIPTPPACPVDEPLPREFRNQIISGDALNEMRRIPSGSVDLVITSPPYNIGKAYERAIDLDEYLHNLSPVVNQLVRVLADDGFLCWFLPIAHRGQTCPTRIK